MIIQLVQNSLRCGWLVVLFMQSSCMLSQSQTFQIVNLICAKSVQIGTKKMKEGDQFDGKEVIYWTNGRQLLEAVEIVNGKSSGEIYKVSKKGFEKYNVKTLSDYWFKVKDLGHRSVADNYRHYRDDYIYLIDTLNIPTRGNSEQDVVIEAVWEYNDTPVVTPIMRTSDGKHYIVTTSIYAEYIPQDVYLTIRERNTRINFINTVYSNIPIIFIPAKLKKKERKLYTF